jgi:serine/threonine protein kinase
MNLFKACLNMKNARVEQKLVTKDNITVFTVIRHGDTVDLLFKDAKFFQVIYTLCKCDLVMSHFTRYFANVKSIGKGSFARVYKIKRLADNKEFAVKVFDKNHLFSMHEKAKVKPMVFMKPINPVGSSTLCTMKSRSCGL